MGDFQLEELEKALTHDYIDWEYIDHDKHGFSRTIRFNLNGLGYRIVWFRNLSKLKCGSLEVRFTKVTQSGTWPNKAKLNLQFYMGNEPVAVLPIEYYPEKMVGGVSDG